MISTSLRPILVAAAAAVMCLVVNPRQSGAAQKAAQKPLPTVEQFTGMAMDNSGGTPKHAGPVDVLIERWSTDADQEKLLRAVIAGGADRLLPAIKTLSRSAGVVLSPGVQGTGSRARERRRHTILFARDVKTATGRQVILATDEHLGLGEGRSTSRMEKNEFTIVDIRFGADGKAVGKVGLADQVTYNTQTKTIELASFDKHPSTLVDVKSVKK